MATGWLYVVKENKNKKKEKARRGRRKKTNLSKVGRFRIEQSRTISRTWSIVRTIRAVRLSNGQSRNSVSTAAKFFYLSSGFCPRSSHRKAIINLGHGEQGAGGLNRVRRKRIKYGCTDMPQEVAFPSENGLARGFLNSTRTSARNVSLYSLLSSFSSSPFPSPKAYVSCVTFFQPFTHLSHPFPVSPFASLSVCLSVSLLLSVILMEEPRKGKKYCVLAYTVMHLFVATKLHPFRARKGYTLILVDWKHKVWYLALAEFSRLLLTLLCPQRILL